MNFQELRSRIKNEVHAGFNPYAHLIAPYCFDQVVEAITNNIAREVSSYLQSKIHYEEVE